MTKIKYNKKRFWKLSFSASPQQKYAILDEREILPEGYSRSATFRSPDHLLGQKERNFPICEASTVFSSVEKNMKYFQYYFRQNEFFYFASTEVRQMGGREISFFQKERNL